MAEAIERDKARQRILRFLAGGGASVRDAAADTTVLLETADRGTISAPRQILSDMARDGIVTRDKDNVALSDLGLRTAGRAMAAAGAFQDRHRDLEMIVIDVDDTRSLVLANLAESPLGQLARRKAKDGSSFLTAAEFDAGERLRSDYTRGQIMPRLSANWTASVASGRRSGGIADLTDAALAARQRVDAAIAAVGPELSGVLIDVCCFLKGLELVETERGWPVRSAKILLKTALGILSRHYNPHAGERRGSSRTLRWGTQDYRPSIG